MKSEYNNMHGERIKIVNAKQAKLYNNFITCVVLNVNCESVLVDGCMSW